MSDALTGQTVELLQQMIRNRCVNDGTVLSGQEVRNSDTLRSYLEGSGLDIEVYEPFLSGTHDEKMFRVVKDRAGWFDVVMGRAVGTDEQETDAEEIRLPLHPRIREALSMDLRSPG